MEGLAMQGKVEPHPLVVGFGSQADEQVRRP